MFDNIVFTGTINLGAISTAIITLLGLYIIYWRGKVSEQKTRRLIQEENRLTRDCIHLIPGHPEYQPDGPHCDPGAPGTPGTPGENPT